jgi:hypothetical protein
VRRDFKLGTLMLDVDGMVSVFVVWAGLRNMLEHGLCKKMVGGR